MTDEKDKDVSFAVSKAIEELDKIEVATEPISRRSSCIEVVLDMKDRLKENEERKQLEMEFNSKFVKENKILIPPVVAGSTNKTGKIPVRKSGTLPKQSQAASTHMNSSKDATPSPYKSLKSIKKERRISSPGLNVDFQKNPTKNLQFTKDCPVSNQSIKNFTSSKCNIPDSRSLSPIIGTWPRQKRASCIPKQSDRCPSPMLQTRRFSVQKTTKIAVPKSANCSPSSPVKNINETSVSGKDKTETQCLLPKDISSKITLESNRKINITPFPSPEVIRRSLTFTNLNAESKIPTSYAKRRSTISEN
ncbi:hypothetical protein X975_18294, partial [Stegodyphus mimosarum]